MNRHLTNEMHVCSGWKKRSTSEDFSEIQYSLEFLKGKGKIVGDTKSRQMYQWELSHVAGGRSIKKFSKYFVLFIKAEYCRFTRRFSNSTPKYTRKEKCTSFYNFSLQIFEDLINHTSFLINDTSVKISIIYIKIKNKVLF